MKLSHGDAIMCVSVCVCVVWWDECLAKLELQDSHYNPPGSFEQFRLNGNLWPWCGSHSHNHTQQSYVNRGQEPQLIFTSNIRMRGGEKHISLITVADPTGWFECFWSRWSAGFSHSRQSLEFSLWVVWQSENIQKAAAAAALQMETSCWQKGSGNGNQPKAYSA